MSTDTPRERTGRTTRMVAEAVAAATTRGTVYIVAATALDASRIARMVEDAVIQAGHTPDRPTLNEVRWHGGRVIVVTISYRLLDTRESEWRILGTRAPLFVDHYAGEVWARRPRPVAP